MENIDDNTSGLGESLDYYYQDELAYMRDMGQAFSEAYPKLAPFLARQGNDPDVERLLEGFSFIASRIRQRMDNTMSEFSQDINSVMWPQLQRPIPSFSIVKFTPPVENISTQKIIERDSEVTSIPVQGTRCTFSTCYDVSLYPLTIKEVNLGKRNGNSTIDITMQMDELASLNDIKFEYIRFYINAGSSSSKIYKYILSQRTNVECQMSSGDEKCVSTLPKNAIKPVGFSTDTYLLPHPVNSMEAHQQLFEYYCYPEKYLFFDVYLDAVRQSDFEFDTLTISIELNKKLDTSDRFNTNSFQLYCTPVVNLFDMDAEPIRRGDQKMEYLVKPANTNQEHYSIFSIDSVIAIDDGGRSSRNLRQLYAAPVSYSGFNSDSYSIQGIQKGARSVSDLYQTRIRPSVTGDIDNFISFRADKIMSSSKSKSTISMQLSCTNRKLPEKLHPGDIKYTGDNIPANIDVVNLHSPSKAVIAQISSDTQWQMLSNFSANYLNFSDERNLKQLLLSYNIPAKVDRQAAREMNNVMDSIVEVDMQPTMKLIEGIPVQGYRIVMTVHGDHFSNEGDMYLFFTVLASYFSLISNINSFSVLEVLDIDRGEVHHWDCNVSGLIDGEINER